MRCCSFPSITAIRRFKHTVETRTASWAGVAVLALGTVVANGAPDRRQITNPMESAGHSNRTDSTQVGSEQEYFIAFVGREAANGSRAGHAFVIIGKGTPMTCDVEHGDGEAFGFYPSSSDNPCEPGPLPTGKVIILKPVPGCLINDLYTPYSNWVTIRCGFEDYLMVLGVIEEWKKRPYRLGQQDCLSFLMEVAKLFDDRLLIPERAGMDMFPNRFVVRLKELNP